MNAAQIKRLVRVGDVFDVTNHYINREDHPCYGTRRAAIALANASSFTLYQEHGTDRIAWPKAAQIRMDGDTILIYGGGVSQGPDDLFLTLARVA